MKKEKTEQELYGIATLMCAGSEHCAFDVQRRLLRHTENQQVIARIIARLYKESYLDDERYARAFIHDKVRFARWGTRRIAMELHQKGIDSHIFEPLLHDINQEEYSDALQSLLRTKARTIKASSPYELRMKLLRFAASRGYNFDEVSKAVEGLEFRV